MEIELVNRDQQIILSQPENRGASKFFQGFIEIIVDSKRHQKFDKKNDYRDKFVGMCNYKNINNLTIERCLKSQRLFHLGGGYLIEIYSSDEEIENSVFNHCKMVQLSQRYNDGSVKFEMGCNEITFDYERIAEILYSTQNNENYTIANKLLKVKPMIMNLKNTIERLFLKQETSQIEQIICKRKEYQEIYKKQSLQMYVNDEDFYQTVTYCLDMSLQSNILTDYTFSNPMIALNGVETEDLINYVMKNTLFWMFSKHSRREFLLSSLEIINSQLNQTFTYLNPNINILTIDEIPLTTPCQITAIPLNYPSDLLFKGEEFDLINKFDYLFIIKYNISIENIKYVIQTREAKISNLNIKQSYMHRELDQYIAENFETYMQNLVFLEKYYEKQIQQKKSKNQQIFQKKRLLQTCSYKYI
ncbi:eukaryotic-type carbonic anhydrase family protein (macronuclear) [Tetrahymena thermophila SB210]|uniref:Eukaryotic-type carbonic anhydrase family protein n=1 Tax=Tetrahymena thermophila (strain SB210) TaxID=312017 RepID=Q23AT0_TETTS|nr:eukaryotic-type carbonic anhydrase family protein [Tetrahymena thermophila SB210]EAR93612.1 eukaryotic-type carbonic anhydrase family protein [Tetrahymena thermophila SB210]|eukprot:XP_001013857.1 eukaryotic-type carbonic anhydrase family protein [Tetrahymena thermophila SB210]